MAAPTKELKEWLDEWPVVRDLVDELLLSLKRRSVPPAAVVDVAVLRALILTSVRMYTCTQTTAGSYETAKMTTSVLSKVVRIQERRMTRISIRC